MRGVTLSEPGCHVSAIRTSIVLPPNLRVPGLGLDHSTIIARLVAVALGKPFCVEILS